MITQKYGYGPTVDKIRQAWYAMDFNRSGYITRHEFSTRAKYEVEKILSQPNYGPSVQPGYRPQPGYGVGYQPQPGYGAYPPHGGYGPGYIPPSHPHYY